MNRSFSRVRMLLLVVALFVFGTSCGSSGPKLHPARGTVLIDDLPADGADVVLQPVNDAPGAVKPSGVVGPDGAFTLSTYPHGAGAPAGEYAVLITWYPPNARELENPKNKLPAKYADATKTPVPKVTIKDGPNELEPIKLSSK